MTKNLIPLVILAICSSCNHNEKENIWPECKLVQPVDISWVTLGETCTIEVEASDADGTIEKVDITIDDELLVSLAKAPYVYTWDVKDIKCGEHILMAHAVDNSGQEIGWGNRITVDAHTANETGKYTDARDNREYGWVKIGEQTWMSENLKYIPLVLPKEVPGEYMYSNKECIWVYGYNSTNVDEAVAGENYKNFGCLYNFPTALKVCPDGWHLPTDDEWKQLESFLGMGAGDLNGFAIRGEKENTGGMLKQSGLEFWNTPNKGSSNESGFTALPGGGFEHGADFTGIKDNALFWALLEDTTNSGHAYCRIMESWGTHVTRSYTDKYRAGLSVRCVKD